MMIETPKPLPYDDPEKWLSSQEAMKALKISACELMHRREAGQLHFKKQGNAYFYKLNNKP